MSGKVKAMKIVRVDKNEFETEDGQVFEHPIPLDEVPSLEEFQKIHNMCATQLNAMLLRDDTSDGNDLDR